MSSGIATNNTKVPDEKAESINDASQAALDGCMSDSSSNSAGTPSPIRKSFSDFLSSLKAHTESKRITSANGEEGSTLASEDEDTAVSEKVSDGKLICIYALIIANR